MLVVKIESMKARFLVSALFIFASHSLPYAQNVTVTAKAPPDEGISQSYMALDRECRNLVGRHDSENAVIACRKVADEADKYDTKTHSITRRAAYVFYTTSLIQAKKYHASQSQPGGMAAGAPPPDNADAPPDIFTAMQQQLGLKLESTKALEDVMVIDRVEKPSPN